MTKICSYYSKDLGEVEPKDVKLTTHGACLDCAEIEISKLDSEYVTITAKVTKELSELLAKKAIIKNKRFAQVISEYIVKGLEAERNQHE